jgi:2-dehydro-3-deoxygalactonokinase
MASQTHLHARTRLLGDWGTSKLRLWWDRDGVVTPWREGPGIGAIDRPAAQILRGILAELPAGEHPRSIALCGMAGARGGLHEAGYADCPADRATWVKHAARIDFDGIPLAIAAGVATPSGGHRADVMRGEETEVFGAMACDPALATGQHTLLLPGTHSKWVTIEDGAIAGFTTFLTGELFALLGRSTLLSAGIAGDNEDAGFAAGLEQARRGLLGELFQARAMQLRKGCSGAWASGFLSGLLIGGEICEAAERGLRPASVPLIGAPALARCYALALATYGIRTQMLDTEKVTLAGLALIHSDTSNADN